MSFFGVQLNSQINKLIYQIKLTLGKNKYNPNFRTIYRSLAKVDPDLTGYVRLEQLDKALNENGIFFKKYQLQVFQKAFGNQQQPNQIHWFSLMSLLRQPMNPTRSAVVQQVFQHLDTSNTGKVHYTSLSIIFITIHQVARFDASEIKEFKLGFKSREKIGEELLALVPLTEDNCVSFEEWMNFYNDLSLNIPDDETFARFVTQQWGCPYKQIKKVAPEQVIAAIKLIRFKLIQRTQGTHQQFILKQLFNELDVNKNNFLGLDQLQKMLIKLQVPVEERFTAELLKKMDYHNNGHVDFDEFKNFLFHEPYLF